MNRLRSHTCERGLVRRSPETPFACSWPRLTYSRIALVEQDLRERTTEGGPMPIGGWSSPRTMAA
jgi:hypothetical protein